MKRERVMARRDRRVRREYGGAAHFVERRVEGPPLLTQLADALEHHECGVTFVQVIHRRRRPHLLEDADAPDPEDDFLLNSRFAVPAVEACREIAIPRRVLLDVRVEQVQLDATNAHHPYLDQYCAVTERHGDDARLALGSDSGFDGGVGPIELLVHLLLPAVRSQVMVEKALRIHEA